MPQRRLINTGVEGGLMCRFVGQVSAKGVVVPSVDVSNRDNLRKRTFHEYTLPPVKRGGRLTELAKAAGRDCGSLSWVTTRQPPFDARVVVAARGKASPWRVAVRSGDWSSSNELTAQSGSQFQFRSQSTPASSPCHTRRSAMDLLLPANVQIGPGGSKCRRMCSGGISAPGVFLGSPAQSSWRRMVVDSDWIASHRMTTNNENLCMPKRGTVKCDGRDDERKSAWKNVQLNLNGMQTPFLAGTVLGLGGLEGLPKIITAAGRGGREDGAIPVLSKRPSNLPYFQDIQRAAGKLLVFGFRGTTVTEHARRLLARGAGGVVLFGRNVNNPAQVAELSISLKKAAGRRPLAVMIDHEGGSVCRLAPPFTKIPAARMVGATRDPRAAWITGAVIGRELRAINIDLNLAPVLDVDTNPANPVIGPRSFGTTAKIVSEMGYSFIRSMQQEGIAACAKHFPGHGDTLVDSHTDLPVSMHSLQRLESVEIPPFHQAVGADVAAVMMGHVVVPALSWKVLDAFEKNRPTDVTLPASLGYGAVRYLRRNLRFEGLILSDCLEMGAIVKNYTVADAAVLAVQAGVDMVLVCHTENQQVAALDAVINAVLKGDIAYERLKEAERRVATFMETYVRPFADTRVERTAELRFEQALLDVVGCAEHQEMIQRVVVKACQSAAAAAAAAAETSSRPNTLSRSLTGATNQKTDTWKNVGDKAADGGFKPEVGKSHDGGDGRLMHLA